ncbi:GNAT family N-acetyltransferase [Modestobacter italicus]|uniref:GNAT family N-acetyltransferase n=1 Tax=Modestobacter italicus (strain DSM 44449 / CECT 9708 / BC 501) TaxID=2732864 RepID=UPI000685A01A|nr:GNAT family N-acetyltransferase [Modestobacter marinus]
MPSPVRLVVEDPPDPDDLALLEAAVEAAAGAGDAREFAVLARDEHARMVAGVSALVWGRCCELQAMWVDPPLRGRGTARALMAAAEAEARRRGCGVVLLQAYDLVAAGLYGRLGYETVAVVEGCPDGSARRWFRKVL